MKKGIKFAAFGRALRSASLRRMNQNIAAIHRETGANRVRLFCDMVWCSVRYGVGYLDYRVFGFARNRGACRKTFMTSYHNITLTRQFNDRACYDLLNDKIKFCQTWDAFLGRPWLDLRQSTPEEFATLLEQAGMVFVKPIGEFGGKGVEKLTAAEVEDVAALHDRLVEEGRVLAEGAIVQHPDLSRLCPSSVNTLRVVTLLLNGEPKLLYALLRVGSGTTNVDNISSGGMYTLIGEDGRLHYPAFCDKTSSFYDRHPVTDEPFVGFEVPCYRQAVELCCEAARVEPRLGYIGWDVAITPDGPVLVEANNLPGYDMVQNARFHPDGQGILPQLEALLGHPIAGK